MPDLDPLIAQLRQCREDQGLSQGRVAELARINRQAISLGECGKSAPTLRTLRLWTAALGVELIIREPT